MAETDASTESGLPEEKILEIAEYLQGTCHSVIGAMAHFDLDESEYDPSDVEADLSSVSNIEICPGCGWWFEAGELTDDEGEPVGCVDCRKDEEANA